MTISVHLLFLALSLLLQQQQAPSLESVLKKMDAAAAGFHTAQADFVWDQYQKVVGETDTQRGTVYYRRAGNEIEMMAQINWFTEQIVGLIAKNKFAQYLNIS